MKMIVRLNRLSTDAKQRIFFYYFFFFVKPSDIFKIVNFCIAALDIHNKSNAM